MLKLASANPLMGKASLSHIKAILDGRFGKKKWLRWDLETFSLDFEMVLDDLTRDKISLLQVMELRPELFFEDVAFFLHAVEVMNNEPADFESMPYPTTLELAFALHEAQVLIPGYTPPDETSVIFDVCAYMLKEEGYSEPVAPFTFVPKDMLVAGQEAGDTKDKQAAIEQYIKHMEAL